MAYRDLRGDETIRQGDEVWNPHWEMWIPLLAGAGCIGSVVDETERQWRRLDEEPESPAIPATPAVVPAPADTAIMAYEDLPPGAELRPGDEWKNPSGRWVKYNSWHVSGTVPVNDRICSRRPHNITQMREDFRKVTVSYREEIEKARIDHKHDVSSVRKTLTAEAEQAGLIFDARLKELESQLAVESANLRAASSEKTKLSEDYRHVMNEFHDVRQQLSRSQRECEELRKQLAEENSDAVKTAGLLMESRGTVERLQDKVNSLESSFAHYGRLRTSAEEKLQAQTLQFEAVRADNERLQKSIEDYRREVSFVQNLLGDARGALAVAESMDAQSSEKIKELEAKITDRDGSLAVLACEAAALRQLNMDLHQELQRLRHQAMAAFDHATHLDLRDDGESELERKAWELFSQIPNLTIDDSFYKAGQWMYCRDQKRKAGAP